MAILATGLLSLAGVFILGLNQLSGSSAALIAREKAREAVESVHTARDTRVIQLVPDLQRRLRPGCRVRGKPAGVFLDGPQPLNNAGTDGLVNTADDDGRRDRGPSVQARTTSLARRRHPDGADELFDEKSKSPRS